MRQNRGIAPNLALDEAIARRRAKGESILHMGFGESRLPVHPGLLEALVRGAESNAYGPVSGADDPKDSVAGYFERRGLPTRADDIILGPGSKSLVLGVIASIPGDVIVARPSWVTYGPQVELAGRTPIWVDIADEFGGVPDPALLEAAISDARNRGLNPTMIIQTSPDNPTGTVAPEYAIKELADIAVNEGLMVISDEIYSDVTFASAPPTIRPAALIPERTIVITGLSKSLSLGGWRVGAARFPSTPNGVDIRMSVAGFASETWSNLARPQQGVIEYAFAEPADLVDYRERCTRLHGIVAGAVHRVFDSHGALCRPPTGGFYVYPHLEPFRESLAATGVVDSASLQTTLLERHGLAVLGGHNFGDDPGALRFRAATSMMYGDSKEPQLAAIEADDPLAVPAVAESLERLDRALTDLLS